MYLYQMIQIRAVKETDLEWKHEYEMPSDNMAIDFAKRYAKVLGKNLEVCKWADDDREYQPFISIKIEIETKTKIIIYDL